MNDLRTLNVMVHRSIVVTLSASIGLLLSCADEHSALTPPTGLRYDGSWTYNYPSVGHDGVPYASDNFLVFSDKAGLAARMTVAAIAEEAYVSTRAFLSVKDEDRTWLPSYEVRKIHIFADVGQQSQNGLAFRDGFIVRSPDAPGFSLTPSFYRNLIHHELAHVFEFQLIGTWNHQAANDVWLREGGASFVAGINTVTTVAQLDAWQTQMTSVPGGGNPVGIHVWGDFPPAFVNSTNAYYPFFELATRMLFDPLAYGRPIDSLKVLYRHLGRGVPFASAFSQSFALSVTEYESGFFEKANEYLVKLEDSQASGSRPAPSPPRAVVR